MTVPFTPLFIDGEWRPASTGATFDVRNPTSGKVVGTAANASAADCVAAVEAAARAFPSWEQTPITVRRDVFLRAADILEKEYRERCAQDPLNEVSMTPDMLFANYHGQIAYLRNYAGMITELKGEIFPAVIPGGQVFAQRRPIGVVFGIAPWNAPIGLTIRAVAVPLICGNTVVLKCSEMTPCSQGIVVEILEKAGLPKGVLNFVATSREDAPARTAEIIAHPRVRKINFTGSDRVGRIIATEAAKHLKPCVLELGGKAPVVVLADADVPRAARAITSSALLNSGQICMSSERVIVQRGAETSLIQELTTLFNRAKAGDVHGDPSTVIGALFTEASGVNVISMIKNAIAEGATLILGDVKAQGAIVQPHIVKDVRPGMALWDRESFGPVIALAVVDSIDEAVDLANASEYSMAASLWTSDGYKALDVSARIRATCTNINGPTIHSEWMRNLGGLGGASGYGRFSVDEWTELRMQVMHPAKEHPYPLFPRLSE